MSSTVLRLLVGIAGVGVVAAATYANIEHAGGLASKDAPLAIALAALLAIGMAYAIVAWMDGKRAQAIALGLCILCGEGYWALVNAEREVADRDARAHPIVEARKAYAEARAAVAAAEADLDNVPTTTKRLTDAIAAKTAIDLAVVAKSDEVGCRVNCKDLLQTQVAAAQKELDAARAEVARDSAIANAKLTSARATLAGLTDPPSATPLPERLGIASWAWDLILAGLRTAGIVGGSLAIGFAIHPSRSRASLPSKAEPHSTRPMTPLQASSPALPAPADASPAARREHVAKFLRDMVKPDPDGAVSLKALADQYPSWCPADPLPSAELGQELRAIFRALGLRTEMTSNDMVIHGARFATAIESQHGSRLAQNISS